MSKNITKILALAITATLFCLSPSTGFTGSAGAEKATPSPSRTTPDSSHRHMHHHGKDGKVRAGKHFIIKESSRLLEMEPSSLVENLKAGKTLSQLALEKKGWTEDQYVQKLAESAGRNMDKAVAEGRITDLEAKKLKEQLPIILKLKINNMDIFHE
ncbi:hypothetical protein [Paenibacillus wynnii]|uniref:hypothetical protein n=1 Tax=Paenibacillus wynnii TaxID=268407 RepID=UPI002791C2FF|nr:hypothetical protein [Paenibacillus wynnii]MDQ0193204.1 hypothetical protein [Paenibacillus wynnii]